jgi:hypothetical protein
MSQCVDEVTGWVGEWVGKVFVCVCVRACGCVSEWVGGRAGECIYCGGVRNKVWGSIICTDRVGWVGYKRLCDQDQQSRVAPAHDGSQRKNPIGKNH